MSDFTPPDIIIVDYSKRTVDVSEITIHGKKHYIWIGKYKNKEKQLYKYEFSKIKNTFDAFTKKDLTEPNDSIKIIDNLTFDQIESIRQKYILPNTPLSLPPPHLFESEQSVLIDKLQQLEENIYDTRDYINFDKMDDEIIHSAEDLEIPPFILWLGVTHKIGIFSGRFEKNSVTKKISYLYNYSAPRGGLPATKPTAYSRYDLTNIDTEGRPPHHIIIYHPMDIIIDSQSGEQKEKYKTLTKAQCTFFENWKNGVWNIYSLNDSKYLLPPFSEDKKHCSNINSESLKNLNINFKLCDTFHDFGDIDVKVVLRDKYTQPFNIDGISLDSLYRNLQLEVINKFNHEIKYKDEILDDLTYNRSSKCFRCDNFDNIVNKNEMITQTNNFLEQNKNSRYIAINLGTPLKLSTPEDTHERSATGMFNNIINEMDNHAKYVTYIIKHYFGTNRKIISNRSQIPNKLLGDLLVHTYAEKYDTGITSASLYKSTQLYGMKEDELHILQNIFIKTNKLTTQIGINTNEVNIDAITRTNPTQEPSLPVTYFKRENITLKDAIKESTFINKIKQLVPLLPTSLNDKIAVCYDLKMAGDGLTVKSAQYFNFIFLTGDQYALYNALYNGCDCIFVQNRDRGNSSRLDVPISDIRLILYKSCHYQIHNSPADTSLPVEHPIQDNTDLLKGRLINIAKYTSALIESMRPVESERPPVITLFDLLTIINAITSKYLCYSLYIQLVIV